MKKKTQTIAEILPLVQAHVQFLFRQENTNHLYFHDYEHTATVAQNCQKAAQILSLDTHQAILLEVAAWFHDIGYIYTYQEHEKKSIELIQQFLAPYQLDTTVVNQLVAAIAATEVGVQPTTLLGLLLKEIDLSYGATQNFKQRGDDLRKEWEINLNKIYSDEAWQQLQLDFLSELNFESDYAKTHLQPLVDYNIKSFD